MKIDVVRVLGIVAVGGVVAVAGCRQRSESEPPKTAGVAERTGAALDRAAEKTVEVATNVAGKTKDAAGVAIEKTGEVMEKAGAAVEKTGENMQK